MTRTAHLLLAVAAAAVVAAVPFVLGTGATDVPGHRAADAAAERCARDGVPLEGALRLRVETTDGRGVPFCSVRCAQAWIDAQPERTVARVLVRDEPSGTEIDASHAVFVRSTVVASRATGERIHAFASEKDAEAHAAAFGGRLLDGEDRPFR